MTATITATEDPEVRRIARLLKIGKRVGLVGLVVLVAGGTLLGVGLYRVFNGLSQIREQLTTEVAVPGTSEVYLETGRYDVVVMGQGLLGRARTNDGEMGDLVRTGYQEPDIRITGRAGSRRVTAAVTNSSFSYSNNNYDLVSMSSFQVHAAGTYLIEVTGEPGPVTSVGIGPAHGVPGGALALGGGALLALGIAVAIGGITTYVIGRTRRSRRQRGLGSIPGCTPAIGAGPYGGGYAGGPHPGGPYSGGYANGPQGLASPGRFPPSPPPSVN